jgi:hypothetical protein
MVNVSAELLTIDYLQKKHWKKCMSVVIVFVSLIIVNLEHYIRLLLWFKYGKVNYNNKMSNALFNDVWTDIEFLKLFENWHKIEFLFLICILFGCLIFLFYYKIIKNLFKNNMTFCLCFVIGQMFYFLFWHLPIYSYLFD